MDLGNFDQVVWNGQKKKISSVRYILDFNIPGGHDASCAFISPCASRRWPTVGSWYTRKSCQPFADVGKRSCQHRNEHLQDVVPLFSQSNVDFGTTCSRRRLCVGGWWIKIGRPSATALALRRPLHRHYAGHFFCFFEMPNTLVKIYYQLPVLLEARKPQ